VNSTPWLVLGLSLPGLALAASPAVPTMPASALRAGQRAEVRTVFSGDSVETFTAEIVGVLPGGRAEGDLILARATSPRVERTGVAQGMSGSPVYVDGRLIGALSSGWPFSREPVFGITPIAEMLSVLDEPESKETDGTAGPSGVDPVPGGRARYRELRWIDDDASEAPDPTPRLAPAVDPRRAALPLPLAVSGANPAAMAAIQGWFEPAGFAVVPGGRERARPDARRTLEPGDAVSVDILRGDLNLSALGTVTYRDGDRVLLFGHPFFQSGEVRLPLSTARITTVLGSVNTSFKIGTPLTPVGVATQDRRSAVAGRLGPSPKLLPIRTTVRGASPRVQQFAFESVEDRNLLPLLVSTAALNSLLESGGNGVMQTVRWSLDLWRRGQVLRLGDVAAGDNPVGDVANTLGAPVRFLASNPYERFHADSIVVTLDTRPGRAQVTLRSVALTRPSVRPGGVATVRAVLERWRGARETVTLEVPVPDELPDGRYVMNVSGGLEFDRFLAARLPSRFRVVSVEDAWTRLAQTRRSDALHVGIWARAPEITSDGEDLPELPNSALAVLAPGQQAGDRARRGEWALVQEVKRSFDEVIRGELVLELVVDRLAP
jgi:hypothetical protein